jgi:predicted nucleotidyltransferase
MKLSQAKIDQIKEYFRDKPVKKAFLFGSFAKGTATSDSDLDILVELDINHRMGLEFIQMKLDLEVLLKKEVGLVTTKGLSHRVLPLVEKTKQLIYAR